jgi:asparagine synthase (glutamine-hydrolysing)
MCGICGIVSRSPAVDEAPVRRMQKALHHRGPDGGGEFFDGHIGLAMRRLSIIDLMGGWQPLYNEDRSIVLIANGEVYNFVELRQELEARGHRFGSGSDCETILHLYEDHGDDCVTRLRGMFAFALWDVKKQRLLLCRDRMGEKPLYLYEAPWGLAFSSEMRSLLSSGLVPFDLDPSAVNLYFHYQYVPEPYTPLKGVRKLDAAHMLAVGVSPWRITETCYWRMEDAPPIGGDPAQAIRGELERISELIIRSDVPVGVALSGGLDSSAIAACATNKYPGTIHAFSVGYSGAHSCDERPDAKAFADHLDIPFHDVEIDTEEMVDGFPGLVYDRDDPVADISGYGYYAVMRLARAHNVPVILQGQGGDELFWGYPWIRQAVKESVQKSRLLSHEASIMNYLGLTGPENWSRSGVFHWAMSAMGLRTGLERYRDHRESPGDRLVFYDLTPDFKMAAGKVRDYYAAPFLEHMDGVGEYGLFTIPAPWPRIDIAITRLVCDTYLRENGFTQGDRLSMASSVELRLPLVDYRFVETVIGLRKTRPDHELAPKALFKSALKGILPDWVVNRPKRGFTPPVQEWYRALFDRYGATLDDGYLVNAAVLRPKAAKELSSGPIPAGSIVPLSFKALVLETWCRECRKVKSLHVKDEIDSIQE